MKFLPVLSIVLAFSFAIHAGPSKRKVANENSLSAEELIKLGGGTTIVGACLNPVVTGSGENQSVTCANPIAFAPTFSGGGCRPQDNQSVLAWDGSQKKFKVVGQICGNYNDTGGNN